MHSCVRLIFIVLIAAAGPACYHQRNALTPDQMSRLDPLLHDILAQTADVEEAYTSHEIAKPVAYDNDKPVYAVIIYTSCADTLRKTGINIQTIMDDFVTARIQSEDLLPLLNLDSVKYIEVSKTDQADD